MKKIQVLQLFLIIFIMSSLSGCGSNLFKSLNLVHTDDSAVTQDNIDSILDNARVGDTASFEKAEKLADIIISDASASKEEKAKAYFVKGEAIMGKNGVSITDIAADLAGNVSQGENLLTKLKGQAKTGVIEAADAMNNAASLTSNLDANQEMTRGLANAIAVIDAIDDVYVVNDDGSLGDPVDNSMSGKERVQALVSANVSTYASESVTAFDNANALSDSQEEDTNQIKEAGDELTAINNALQGGAPYTRVVDGRTIILTPTSSDDDIDTVMQDVFNFN